MKDKEKKMIFGIGIVFLFLATVGFSYAYFSANITNKDVKDQVVTTGTLRLTYTDGPEIKMLNIKPGSTFTKEVSVKNTGTLDTAYNLVWQELSNEITNDEMVISATCERRNANGEIEETCEGLSEAAIGANIIKKNIAIESGVTHKYVITITFKETSADQNYNQNKKFSGVLGINEYKDNSPAAVYCTFDGEMVQGAEYVNGQYTYKYMQEGANSSSGLAWNNITNDGWGVQLTDKTSTEPATGELCTYINDKPVVSMAYMFFLSQASEINLNDVNTSNVLDMSRMFNDTKATKINLNNIDTSNVINMNHMFGVSKATVLDLKSFDTSNVTDMSYMFNGYEATVLDVSSFDTSKVTTMEGMFSYTSATTLDLSNFDTSKVINMKSMFEYSKATTLDISNFNTSNVTDMSGMFQESQAKTLDVTGFDTSSVTNMSNMFQSSKATTLDISNFNTSNVTNMGAMFASSQATILDVSKFDTSSVTSMGSMFSGSKATTLDVSKFDTSSVTNMSAMFSGSKATTLDVSKFDTSNVTVMSYMFSSSKAATLDLSSFDTSNVTNMYQMFMNSSNLTTIYASDKFVTNKITNTTLGTYLFSNDTKLVGGAGTAYSSTKTDKTYARIDGGTSSPGYFTKK